MTDRTLRGKAAKLQSLNAEMARMQEQADQLKADITTELEARAVDELKAGSVLLRWKEVSSTRFDGKAFREAHSGLYERYARTSTTKRFTLVPA